MTDTNTTQLDPYNPRHFVQSTITDVYQLYYKNDGSFYCDNIHDATNKKLVMLIKPNANNPRKEELIHGYNNYTQHIEMDKDKIFLRRNLTKEGKCISKVF